MQSIAFGLKNKRQDKIGEVTFYDSLYSDRLSEMHKAYKCLGSWQLPQIEPQISQHTFSASFPLATGRSRS